MYSIYITAQHTGSDQTSNQASAQTRAGSRPVSTTRHRLQHSTPSS